MQYEKSRWEYPVASEVGCMRNGGKFKLCEAPYQWNSTFLWHFLVLSSYFLLDLCLLHLNLNELVNNPVSRHLCDITNRKWPLRWGYGNCKLLIVTIIVSYKNAFGKNIPMMFSLTVFGKYLLQEVSGRAIRIEYAKRFKKPRPPRAPGPQFGETRHKLYVSNLGWKVRSSHLREFFSANFKPVATRVVFDAPSGRAAGYGFVSFATKEEAEEAISSLDGKVSNIEQFCWHFFILFGNLTCAWLVHVEFGVLCTLQWVILFQ